VVKAFDYINHGILAELWFISFFANRKLKVKTRPPNAVQNFFCKTCISTRVSPGAFAFHNILQYTCSQNP
jgi:hypothetical protein